MLPREAFPKRNRIEINTASTSGASLNQEHNHYMRDHKYFAYIVCSRSGTLYIGMTNNLYRRALEHKSGSIEGFASKYHWERLVYYESFDQVQKAIAREKQLKGWRREKKIALIESKNPRWEDLAEKWGSLMAFPGESIKARSPLSSWAKKQIRPHPCHPERSRIASKANDHAKSKDPMPI
jgi:putative endonuclease